MAAYYNEIDPFAAQWLRELIKAGHIAPGDVDERSIDDVRTDELVGYTQCHFFAGVGAWSYALRQAGWPDSRPIWTGSCPCQPFSAAGKGAGFDDERHLWPSFQWLIQQCRPATVVGEQVASKSADAWIDLVQADMEAMGYAFGCVAFPAAGVGAPHIRDRAYWVGHSISAGLERFAGNGGAARRQRQNRPVTEAGLSGGLAYTDGARSQPRQQAAATARHGNTADSDGCAIGLADATSDRWLPQGLEGNAATDRPGQVNGYWANADWIGCRDNKWRPVEPGVSPLVASSTNRVGKLRGYGNAINAEAAKAFIEAIIGD